MLQLCSDEEIMKTCLLKTYIKTYLLNAKVAMT